MIGLLLALGAAICWGSVGLIVKKTKISGLYGIGISITTAVLFLGIYLSLFSPQLLFSLDLNWNDLLLLALIGLFQFLLGTIFYYQAIHFSDLSLTTPITRAKTILVVLASLVLGLEVFSWNIVLAITAVLCGSVLMSWGVGFGSSQFKKNTKIGVLFSFLAAIAWGIGDVSAKFVSHLHPVMIVFFSILIGWLIYFFYLILFNRKGLKTILMAEKNDKLKYVFHGIISLTIGYTLFFTAIQTAGLAKAVIISSCWPLISMVLGFLVFKEKATVWKIVGAIFLIGSAILVVI